MTTHPEVPQATAREEARALTVRQPWASLISTGVKTIETRGWSTRYRGTLLIHAGQTTPERGDYGGWRVGRVRAPENAPWRLSRSTVGPLLPGISTLRECHTLPLGAVVASCQLADCVPIVDADDCEWHVEHPDGVEPCAHAAIDGQVIVHAPWRGYSTTITMDLPFGDFSPGRSAWLLDDIKPTTEPIPCRGKQGLWVPPLEAEPLFRAPFIEAQREEA